MSWLRIDDGFAENPKIADLADRTFRLHVVALCYCARNLTDGRITKRGLKIVSAIIGAARVGPNVAQLEDAGLWLPTDDGWKIKDFLEYNPTAEKVKMERVQARQRMAKHRSKERGNVTETVDYSAILERDGHVCHICNRNVSPGQVAFDHVMPISRGGSHTAENIKVAHVRCNLVKNDSLPEKFGGSSAEQTEKFGDARSGTPSRPLPQEERTSMATPVDNSREEQLTETLVYMDSIGFQGRPRLEALALGPTLMDEAIRRTRSRQDVDNPAAYFTTVTRNLLAVQRAWKSDMPLEDRLTVYVRNAGHEYANDVLADELARKGADDELVARLLVKADEIRQEAA
jgi:5-methylcytosine-specific restriction endonuclease McrA